MSDNPCKDLLIEVLSDHDNYYYLEELDKFPADLKKEILSEVIKRNYSCYEYLSAEDKKNPEYIEIYKRTIINYLLHSKDKSFEYVLNDITYLDTRSLVIILNDPEVQDAVEKGWINQLNSNISEYYKKAPKKLQEDEVFKKKYEEYSENSLLEELKKKYPDYKIEKK
jgi:hypothetical protein